MLKLIKFFIGILLIPTALFLLYDFSGIFIKLISNFSLTLFFLIGASIYLLLHFFVYNFSGPYVLAHEMSHAICAWLCGYKVTAMKVKEGSGYTKISGSNFFVFLAPYIVPLFPIIFVLIYLITSVFYKPITQYRNIFLFIVGFFMAHHLTHPYLSLTETEQSDIGGAGGHIFSFPLIILINIALLLILIEFLFPNIIEADTLIEKLFNQTITFWKQFFIYIGKLIGWVRQL